MATRVKKEREHWLPWSSAADPGDGAQRWDKVQDKPATGEVSGGCPVRMKPSGQCGEEDDCPYQITLPPLTIQLPKQFRMLEKTMKELQSLKETVNRLKRDCLECRQQADQSLQRDSGEAAGGPGTGTGPGFLEIQSELKPHAQLSMECKLVITKFHFHLEVTLGDIFQ
uniref:Uncharacterized protein n=1 Tax=Hucho hucho TaxID=62062 RepID=A0A4W5Q688_9TELE